MHDEKGWLLRIEGEAGMKIPPAASLVQHAGTGVRDFGGEQRARAGLGGKQPIVQRPADAVALVGVEHRQFDEYPGVFHSAEC